ncbi:hypothetical protein, partial [Polaromonas hydrogenivorans]|uniref:hypothetical protein n=1 Tax=Polaromonas hydrogenivorans TaxID=335476 RepID=UPI0039F0595A
MAGFEQCLLLEFGGVMGMRFSVHEMSLALRITRGKSEATTILTPGEIENTVLPGLAVSCNAGCICPIKRPV